MTPPRKMFATPEFRLAALTAGATLLSAAMTAQLVLRSNWWAAAGVGVGTAVLAGLFAWWVARTASWSRARDNSEVLLQQLSAVLEHAEIPIAFTRQGRFELVSAHFCRVFGWSASQVLGQPTSVVWPSEEAFKAFGEQAGPLFSKHGGFEGEVQLMRRDGAVFWVHARGRGVVHGDPAQGTIWLLDDISKVREHREQLAWTASHDLLTGLTNRVGFVPLLDQAIEQSMRQPSCVLFIDLDRFKAVNDTAGHAAGDALLRELGRQLAAQVRQSDTVARLGGDEFAVLLPHCPVPQAMTIADKLRAAVEAHVLAWEGRHFSVGASIGVVPVSEAFASHIDLLRAADAACYLAKHGGRNRVVLYSGQSDVSAASPETPAA